MMRHVVTALLVVFTSAPMLVLPLARVERLRWCSQVCRDRLVPCAYSDHERVTTRRRVSAPTSCRQVRGITSRQRAFCRRNRDLLPALVSGVRSGTDQCRRRFRHHRWNCHALGQHLQFGHVQVEGTPEAAVQYALQSAAITYALFAECRRGALASCSCGLGERRAHTLEQWKRAGCQSGLVFSARKSRSFVNARETEGDARSKMNVHNNNVGVRMVKRRSRRRSLCHGVSGSCSLVTRWQQAPRSFSAIAAPLAAERALSVLVVVGPDGELREAGTGQRPSRRRLVHLELSPDYCLADPRTGFPGTTGRACRRNNSVVGSCTDLCCGRGHSTRVMRQEFCCNFHTNSAHPSRCRQKTRVRTCN